MADLPKTLVLEQLQETSLQCLGGRFAVDTVDGTHELDLRNVF
jgi:hypothetical protein